MAVEDDQTKWRTVFCKDPSLLLMTSYPDADTPHLVVQPDPADFKCTNTPDGVTKQPVQQVDRIQGIWPIQEAARVHASNFQAGVGITVIYTVPANKALYISSSSLAGYETANATSNCRMGIRTGGAAWRAWLVYIYFAVIGQMVVPMRYSPAIEAEAGWEVFVESSNAAIGCRGQIYGWLEDV